MRACPRLGHDDSQLEIWQKCLFESFMHHACFCLCKIVECEASKSCIYKNSKINVELNLTHTVIRTALSVDERKVLMANW